MSTATATDSTTPPVGLTQTEAEKRQKARKPSRQQSGSRSYASIAVANTFTIFNLILAGFGAATIIFGNPRDALFLGILVANIAIGTFQEVRAKRTLDKLSALLVVKTTVVRDGEPREVPVNEVVKGDLVRVGSGDQIVADGTLVRADGLALDESELTGESEPVLRGPGDPVLSGSFAVEGEGRLRGDRGRLREPRRPADRDRARLPPPALAAGAGDGPAADHPRRRDAAAGDRPRRLAGTSMTSPRNGRSRR